MKAVLCPVCNGGGTIPTSGTAVAPEKTCHGCDGKGWVTVPEDPKENIYLIPYAGTTITIRQMYWNPWTWWY